MIAPRFYRSPIALPERSSGDLSVVHHTLTGSVSIIGMRQGFLTGRHAIACKLSAPLRVHQLVDKERGVWMTDLPEELFQIATALHEVQPFGRVLVGGLGLGILAKTLYQQAEVASVTVIERSADVIALCASPEYTVFRDDILRFLTNTFGRFDCYMLDTWQGTNEATYWDTVLPLRRAIRNRHGSLPKVWCWAEDIMRGQVRRALQRPHRSWYYKHLPTPMTLGAANWFLRNVGTKSWEKRYGALIDRAYADIKKEAA